MDKKLNEAVAALRPQMVAALQRLVRRRSVEAYPLPGKPFGEEVDACFAEALALCHELGFETADMDRYIGWCEIGTGDEMVAVLGIWTWCPRARAGITRPTPPRSRAAGCMAGVPLMTKARWWPACLR